MATKLGTLTLDLVARIGSFTQGMRQASTTAEREMRRVENSVVTVDSLIKKLAVTAGAVFSVSQIVGYADAHTDIVNKLKLVTDGQQQLSTAMADTHKIAQDTASSWSAVNDVYSKYMSNSKILNLTQAQTARLTEITSKAVAISGSTTQAAAGALFQYGQTLDGNILRAQEYNSLVDGAGGLLNAMAKGLNVTRGELRQMMLDGKLTGEVIAGALLKAGDSVDDLFSKTATTVAASFNLIKNEAIKVVGEFDGATGASKTFVDGMSSVANNMEAITTIMAVGSAFMAGTYIPAIYGATIAGYAKTKQIVEQTAIQYGAINAERAAAASSLAQAQAQLVNTQSTLAALAAEKTLEVQRLQAQINAVGRMASTTRMAQLRQIEVQVTAELTAAETALAAARARSTAAAAANMGIGRAALGILGGPVGMGLTLAAVAAGYLLMKDGADKATASIDYQGQKLDDLVVKYRELNTLQRDNETKALADQVQDLSLKFRVASSDLTGFMQALPVSDEKINTWSKLHSQFSLGKISSDEYYKSIKALNFLSDEQLNKVRGLIGGYESSNTKMKQAEVAQKTLAIAAGQTTTEVKKQAVETAKLTEELEKLLKTSSESIKSSAITSALASRGYNDTMIDLANKYLSVEGAIVTNVKGQRVLRDDLKKMLKAEYEARMASKNAVDSRNKSEEKTKKLIEAQGSAMKVNALVASNAAKANYAALESAKNLPKGLLSAVNMTESPNSNTAKSGAGAKGAFQFMPKTAERFSVDVNSINSSAKGASEYLDKLLKMFEGNLENTLRAYNWGEGNMQNYLKYGSGMKNGQKGYFSDKPMPKETREYSGKVMGYMGGASGASFNEEYSFDDWLKEQEQFAVEREKRDKEMAAKRKEVELGIASEVGRVRSRLADDIKEIDEAEFSPAKAAELKAEYQKRAEIDIQIAEAAHSDKLSGYSDYMKSEEQLLNESYARRQRDLKLDLNNSSDEYTAASLALEDQRKREVETIRRDQELDILQTKRDWMDKGKWAEEYYALIREEILNTQSYSPEMKDAKIKEVNFNQGMEQNAEREGVWSDYKSMMGLDDSPYKQDMDLLAEARAQMLITEEEYQQQRLAMQLSYGSQYGADFAGMMMGLVDSSSSAYAILGSIQKGAALFSTAMNSYTAISAAWASAPFPYNLPAVGMATMETGLLQAAVSALSPTGFADGGYTGDGGKYTIGGIVHKGEGVLTQEEIAALGGPAGFYALRQSIKNGFSEGGLVLDPPRVLNPSQNSEIKKAMDQVQSNNSQSPQVNLNPNFTFVDERENPHDYMYGPNGEKAVMRILKRNGVV